MRPCDHTDLSACGLDRRAVRRAKAVAERSSYEFSGVAMEGRGLCSACAVGKAA